VGGAAEESETANTAILKVMPLGIMLLLISLLVQFNSFRKVFIILMTIPLIFAGVFPALLLNDLPFSFFSLLGTLALIGIVVNTGILLVDRIDSNLLSGDPLHQAISEAITRRLRPILLTTITTIAGLLPLALTSATLWPPFAWSMIGGLLSSTLLALVVVPSLYILILGRTQSEEVSAPSPVQGAASALSALVVVGFLVALSSEKSLAEPLSLKAVVEKAEDRALYQASNQETRALKKQLSVQRGNAYLPKVGAEFQRFRRDRNLALETPIGSFELTEPWNTQANLVATQPLFDLENMEYKINSLKHQVKGQEALTGRLKKQVKVEAARAYLSLLILDSQLKTNIQLTKNLNDRKNEIVRLFDLGRVSQLDKEKINIAIDESEQRVFAIRQKKKVLQLSIAQFIGQDQPVEAIASSVQGFDPVRNQETNAQRLDLQALTSIKEASREAIKSTRSAYLPKVSLQGRMIYDSPGQFQQTEWVEVGVVARWEIFSGNTRYQKLQSQKANLQAATAKEKETRLAIEVEKANAEAELNTIEKDKGVRDRSVKRAKQVIRSERERYRKGKSTLNDLIDAEILLTEAQGQLDIYPYELLQRQLNHILATGGEI
ncbi:MAG: efflux RND transporter permease subunit, partial [Pseudomonadota bacterium]